MTEGEAASVNTEPSRRWRRRRRAPVWQTEATRRQRLRDDPELAAALARRAAIRGAPRAQVAWGHLLLNGHGIPRDPQAALRWFVSAAKAGDAEGMTMAGRCFELGLGMASDPAEAVRWYRRAAQANDPWGQFNLACLMLQDNGVTRDARAALALLVRSARQGNAKAGNMIGRAREEGWIGPVKIISARRWYLWAAEGGCFRGMFHTARFLFGDGHVEEAVAWLRKSIASAPLDFCEDVAGLLRGHADPRLRHMAEVAHLRVVPRADRECD